MTSIFYPAELILLNEERTFAQPSSAAILPVSLDWPDPAFRQALAICADGEKIWPEDEG